MHLKLIVTFCLALLASAVGQYGFYSEPSGFGAGSYYAGSGFSQLAGAQRDPRANTGPVVFPPSPPGDPSQTSGVIVGASGYGFVAPSQVAFDNQGFIIRNPTKTADKAAVAYNPIKYRPAYQINRFS